MYTSLLAVQTCKCRVVRHDLVGVSQYVSKTQPDYKINILNGSATLLATKNSNVTQNTGNMYLLMMSSESTCLLNGFGYRLQKAPVTWSQLNLRTPEYIYKLPRSTIKVLFESKTKSLLLEHTICTVELHLGCKNYKYHENEETGRS